MNWRRETGRDFSLYSSGTPENVGPGSYNIDGLSVRGTKAGVAFGSSRNRDTLGQSRNETPAPGSYEINTKSHKIPKTSCFHSGTERKLYQISQNPSPADYGKIKDWSTKKTPSTIIRYEKYRPESPMVGQDVDGYELRDDGSVKAVKTQFHGSEWVGPGSYSPKLPKSNGHSLKGSFRDCKIGGVSETPGPGTYNPNKKYKSEAHKISERHLHQEETNDLAGEIGPEEWKTNGSLSSQFSSRNERNLWKTQDKTPAPTAYQTNESTMNQKSVSHVNSGFGQRSARFSEQVNKDPGPGQYEAKRLKWVKSSKSSLRHAREGKHSNDTPGPGQYDVEKCGHSVQRPNSSFSTSRKGGIFDTRDNPGPGEYDVGYSSIKRTGHDIHGSRTQFGSFLNVPTAENPGPDSYITSNTLNRGKTISRQDRFREIKNETPGPGAYNIGQSSMIKKSYNVDYLRKFR